MTRWLCAPRDAKPDAYDEYASTPPRAHSSAIVWPVEVEGR